MTIWNTFGQNLRRPAYRSLADQIAKAIDSGKLKTGDRLPTHRDLAHRLDLSVQTVSRAYDELIRRGLIKGHVGRGTFVNAKPVDTQAPYLQSLQEERLLDFSNLKPVSSRMHLDRMSAALRDLSETLPPSSIFSTRPANALRPYRAAAADWLSRCGLRCPPDRVLITNGSSPAMTTALLTAAGPGGTVVSGEMCHHPLIRLSRYLDLRLHGIAQDAEGIIPEMLDRHCRTNRIDALFVLPNGLNPMALMMSLERREALAEIARKHDFLIVENDAWGPLQPERLPPIASLAPERTLYFTSFTKCLLSGLRIGYLAVPETLEPAAENRHLATDWIATPLIAAIATKWIEDGTADELLAWQRAALARRNRLAADILQDIPFNASPNGLHIWLPLPDQWPETAFVEQARQKGVVLAPGSAFALPDATPRPGIRICLGNLGEEQCADGLDLIGRIYHSRPEPALHIF
ncbi:PLP-dependent aminotransferase family protein [Roseibium aggregatum]|uniref:PLP-dependent aminotransferase family protein n=1 Tax=Roseibium aggregatum TaxID=187304 RepID=A0A939EHA7_9HYPH|nr:PLP-dependent aminotransferase family protein [Roseibium aggregatum]MBN9672963.1 PLP-dependent aminotransferase family protein [Roseibium aggregatum]